MRIAFNSVMANNLNESNGLISQNPKIIQRSLIVGKRKSDSQDPLSLYVSTSLSLSFLIFVTGTTGGARVKKIAGVNFYRFNAKIWQFTV